MRESRTYGSVRGACDETHAPTLLSALRPLSEGEQTMLDMGGG